MKKKALIVSVFFVTLVAFLVYLNMPNAVERYARAQGNEIGKSAQYLSTLAEQGKLTPDQADEILITLQPRLRDMAGRIRAGNSHFEIFYDELRLAWQLVLQGTVSASEAADLLQAICSCRCRYEEERNSRPAIIGLHGRIPELLPGIVIRHRVWVNLGQEEQLVLGLEGFLCNNSNGTHNRSWGLRNSVEFPFTGQASLPLSKETTVYLIPRDVAKDLPSREADADQLGVFKEALSHADARQLCSFQEEAVLSKKNSWKSDFLPVDEK